MAAIKTVQLDISFPSAPAAGTQRFEVAYLNQVGPDVGEPQSIILLAGEKRIDLTLLLSDLGWYAVEDALNGWLQSPKNPDFVSTAPKKA